MPLQPPAPVEVDFGDAEISSAVLRGNELVVNFSMAIVRAPIDFSGCESAELATPSFSLAMNQVESAGSRDGIIGTVRSGYLELDGNRHKRLKIPSSHVGEVRLHLHLANGSVLETQSKSYEVQGFGSAPLVELFRC